MHQHVEAPPTDHLAEHGAALVALGLAMQKQSSTITELAILAHKADLCIEFRIGELKS